MVTLLFHCLTDLKQCETVAVWIEKDQSSTIVRRRYRDYFSNDPSSTFMTSLQKPAQWLITGRSIGNVAAVQDGSLSKSTDYWVDPYHMETVQALSLEDVFTSMDTWTNTTMSSGELRMYSAHSGPHSYPDDTVSSVNDGNVPGRQSTTTIPAKLDGAPPQYALIAIRHLNTTFQRRWIGRTGPIRQI
ncbi:hypothetical protein FQA39_LY01002 [Lamprigera yunnana]|nr:hypothetical protein FQA39_LY01002 [Lamprigera yunnana]